MAKPPVDADPEKFIIGRGVYDNLQTATPVFENGVFRLAPTPMPLWTMVIYNIAFAAFCFGFHWMLKYHTHGEAGPWAVYGAPIGIGLFTCMFFTAVVYIAFAKANRLGPWLIYDTKAGRIELPREREVFERKEIVHLQYITTKRLDWGGVVSNQRLSELNLITCRQGVRKRWPLLRSIFNVRAFDRMLKPLIEHTDLPVVRVEDEWLGWNVSERPYSRTADNRRSPCRSAKRI
jgi:hypothetical protein